MNWKKAMVAEKARWGTGWNKLRRWGRAGPHGLWLTGAFGSFLRMWGSSWVLNMDDVLKPVISEAHSLQNNTDHFAVMGMVHILPGRQSGHSRMWLLSACSEAGAAEELALKMEPPLLDSAGLECIGGRGDTRPGIVTRVPFSISCSSSSSSSLGKAVLTSPEDPAWSDCCGPASLFSWLSVSLLLGKRHSLARLCLVCCQHRGSDIFSTYSGELPGRRCVLRGDLLIDYTSACFSGPEMSSFVLGPASDVSASPLLLRCVDGSTVPQESGLQSHLHRRGSQRGLHVSAASEGQGPAPWCQARLPMKPPSVFLPVCTSENSLLAVPTKSRSTRGQFLHENRKPGPCSPRTPD